MNWLTNLIRPKIRALMKKDVAEDLWSKCPQCEQMIFHKELDKNHKVCPHCDYHYRISADLRLKLLYDNNEYKLIAVPAPPQDPLHFRDSKRYTDRLRDAKAKTNAEDAIKLAIGEVKGVKCVIAVFDFAFIGGSMGMYVGNALLKGAEVAAADKIPFIVIPSSGGARMQEGILSLMQMARTTLASRIVKEEKAPFITVLTDPTTGGVSASFASLGDVIMAETGAVIGFTGARVIEQTIKEKLPEGFQRAEYLLEHGMVDMVVHRHKLKTQLGNVLGMLTKQ